MDGGQVDGRQGLQRLIEERGEDYAGLSRLLGRNPAYIQQFIKRGTPRTLAERDRRTLARYFGVEERVLGGGAPPEPLPGRLVEVPLLRVGASAGPGALPDDERAAGHLAFDAAWLRRLAGSGDAKRLSIIQVEGDSMVPTLSDGDDILVDAGDGAERLRDGIYVLRRDDALMVKRLFVHPAGRSVTIRSDNEVYPSWPDCPVGDLQIIGRVVWAGRRVS